MKPTVSFIVPCYRYARYLPECVNSILAQTCGDFEVLIMDDCSPDNTPEVARSFKDPRVTHFRQPVNIGSGANINVGVGRARGSYLWVLSADDGLARPDALARCVAVAEKHPETGFVFSSAVGRCEGHEDRLLRWTKIRERDEVFRNTKSYELIVAGNCVCAPSVMIRAACWETAGPWPRGPRYCPDWLLWCRLAFHYDVAYMAEPMAFYRMHEASMWHTQLRQQRTAVVEHPQQVRWLLLALARKVADARKIRMTVDGIVRHYVLCLTGQYTISLPASGGLESFGMSQTAFARALEQECRDAKLAGQIRSRVRRGVADYYGRLGRRCQAAGDLAEARRCYRKAVRFNPLKLKTWARWLRLSADGAKQQQ